MSKLRTFTYASTGAALFFLAGAYGGYALASMRGAQWGWACHEITTRSYVNALRTLRSGDLDAAKDTLEGGITLQILTMSARWDTLTDTAGQSLRDTMAYVKRYRQEFPRIESDPQVNAAIAATLSRVDAGK